jgi:hypothetical protein
MPDRRHRIQVFLDDVPRLDVVDAVAVRMQPTSDPVARMVQQGQKPRRTRVAPGELNRAAVEITWIREHRADIT